MNNEINEQQVIENFDEIEPVIDTSSKEKKGNTSKRKKRQGITAAVTLVLILAVGVVGNWYYENTDVSKTIEPLLSAATQKTLGEAELVDAQKNTDENSYFSSARLERQTSRDEALQKIQEISNSTTASKEEKLEATKEITKISKYISIENKIETLVCAKGITNCLAVIDIEGTRVDVIVDTESLDDATILQIKEIATAQLGCSFENVSIIQSNK